MSEVEKIEQKIQNLSVEDFAKLRSWFWEFDNSAWDRQIEADLAAGKLDGIISESLSEYNSGKAKRI